MTKNQLYYFTKFTDFISRVLGPDYEVALHDISDRGGALVAIANSHISGRDLGAPLTEKTLQIIENREYEHKDYILHHFGLTDSGRMLSSSSMFIKDETGELLGLLCINFDDSRYRELSQKVFNLCHPDNFVENNFRFDESRIPQQAYVDDVERFHSSHSGSVTHAIGDIIRENNLSAEKLSLDEKLSIVEKLASDGAFLVKGAVKDAAKCLGCSQATIYRYLSRIKG